jgi:ubiquinone/menaquinone biosynthesis C-methylase UbiE
MFDAGFFDRYAERWDSMGPADLPERIRRVITLAGIRSGGRVLDVGTGTGVTLKCLSDSVGSEGSVFAIDVSEAMLRVAARKVLPSNVFLIRANASRPCFRPGVFDAVICNAVYPHFDNGFATLQQLSGLLRDDGHLTISHPIGRAAVNQIHQCENGRVAEERVPTPARVKSLLRSSGLRDVWVLDEPEFYMARGSKA